MEQNRPPSRRERRRPADGPQVVDVDVAVIGAGPSGLSAAYYLRRGGVLPVGAPDWVPDAASYVVLDDAPGPGGSWRDRWPGLPQVVARDVHLPGATLDVSDPAVPARDSMPGLLNRYEQGKNLHVLRPLHVTQVIRDEDRLAVVTAQVNKPEVEIVWRVRGVVNASGSRSHPFWPRVPGQRQFDGRQLHIKDVQDVAELGDGHVVVVGGCRSALHLVAELAEMTTVTWAARDLPVVEDGDLTPTVRFARDRGLLRPRPMFERIGRRGVWFGPETGPGWAGGSPFVAARTIVWATGFRPAVKHLAPLRLRLADPVSVDGPQVVDEPRLQIIGSSALQRTQHDARVAVSNLRRLLGM